MIYYKKCVHTCNQVVKFFFFPKMLLFVFYQGYIDFFISTVCALAINLLIANQCCSGQKSTTGWLISTSLAIKILKHHSFLSPQAELRALEEGDGSVGGSSPCSEASQEGSRGLLKKTKWKTAFLRAQSPDSNSRGSDKTEWDTAEPVDTGNLKN